MASIAVLQLIWIGQAVEAAPVVRYWEPPAWAARDSAAGHAARLAAAGVRLHAEQSDREPGVGAAGAARGDGHPRRHAQSGDVGPRPVVAGAPGRGGGGGGGAALCRVRALALLFLPRIEAKQRAKWGEAAWADFTARSSNVPFVAMAQGRARLNWREIGAVRLAATAALYVAILLWLHPRIAGVPAW